jgi:hypothetical protein
MIDSSDPLDIDGVLDRVKAMLLAGYHNIVITSADVEVEGESDYVDQPEGQHGTLILRIPLKELGQQRQPIEES